MPCVCSTQCQVRYCVCVQNIVCVPHCYLRKRPGLSPRFSLSKLSTVLCCTCCARAVCLLHFGFCSDSQSGWCLFSWSFPVSEIWGLEQSGSSPYQKRLRTCPFTPMDLLRCNIVLWLMGATLCGLVGSIVPVRVRKYIWKHRR